MKKQEIQDNLDLMYLKSQEEKFYHYILTQYHFHNITRFNNNTIYNFLLDNNVSQRTASSSRSRVSNNLCRLNKVRKIGKIDNLLHFEIVDPLDFEVGEVKKSLSSIDKLLKQGSSLSLKILKSNSDNKIKKEYSNQVQKYLIKLLNVKYKNTWSIEKAEAECISKANLKFRDNPQMNIRIFFNTTEKELKKDNKLK